MLSYINGLHCCNGCLSQLLKKFYGVFLSRNESKCLILVVLAGHTANGMVCVRFGLITSDTDVDELVTLVYNIGKDVEESSKVRQLLYNIFLTLNYSSSGGVGGIKFVFKIFMFLLTFYPSFWSPCQR